MSTRDLVLVRKLTSSQTHLAMTMTAGALPIMKMCQMGSKAAAVAAVEYEGKKAAVDVSACSWKIVRKWAGKVARAVEYGTVPGGDGDDCNECSDGH
jgi:hypothetical protein